MITNEKWRFFSQSAKLAFPSTLACNKLAIFLFKALNKIGCQINDICNDFRKFKRCQHTNYENMNRQTCRFVQLNHFIHVLMLILAHF